MNDITYRQGLRTKGFQVTVPTTGSQQTLSLSGLAKSFEGIILSATTSAAPSVLINPLQLKISLTINNDVAIDDDVADKYATGSGGFAGGWPYFIPVPRRLTGQDTIVLRVTNSSGASQILNVTVWYRNQI
jgi:hypothetical protein|tara:strand:+ start:3869 stop:4261 length:393 start_codon:yes stop_codon:yes gene_type:complete